MTPPLRILHLEDDPIDSELVHYNLQSQGLACEIQRVDNNNDFSQALERGDTDLILADVSLPGYDGMDALRLARRLRPEVPFLLVSGVIGEEAAIDALQNGATDYILKDRLSRLGPSIRRALHEVALRHEQLSLGNQLARAQKLEIFGELAGSIAHDFNNVLTIIMANSGLLMAGLKESDRLHKHALQIEYASSHAAALTRQLLIFSRQEIRQPVVLPLNAILENTEAMLQRLIPESIELTLSPSDTPLQVAADQSDLQQVLINLVLNARDAIHTEGRIHIATGCVEKVPPRSLAASEPQEFAFFRVEDNGSGMTPEVAARLFEPFFTTKPPGCGTGLGLATCQRIIAASKGHITVESTPEHGSILTVFLPRLPAPAPNAEAPPAGPAPPLQPQRGVEKILLAEDNHMLRDLIANLLSELGYHVLQASNGLEGLDIFAAHKQAPPVLVITDVILPLLGGREMARLLQIRQPGLKVLYTSGYPDETLAPRGIPSPGLNFIRKPFTLPQLTQKLRELLDPAN